MALQIALDREGRSLKGYAFTLRYDPAAWAFEDANAIVPMFVARPDGTGGLQAAGAVSEGVLDTNHPVTDLHFRRLKKDGAPISVIEAMAFDTENMRVIMSPRDAVDRLEDGAEYILRQNAPNPFNPQTQIVYAIPEAGRVRLTVYNLLGQAVRTLVDAAQGSGRYEVLWNGRDDTGRTVASGVYVYRIEAGRFSAVRRMVFLK